jgi:ParB-like chromosome segregation protein Spo0J
MSVQNPARFLSSVADRFRLSITYLPIAELKPDPANPRRHSKKQIRQIANSIDEFGFVAPILIDRNRKVVAGHGRLSACGLLGISEVPTVCLEHVTPAQARAFMIADNRLSEIATWDDKLLAEALKDLSLLDLDFSIELTGFEMGEIDLRIASIGEVAGLADDPAEAVPELPARPPVRKPEICGALGRISFCAAMPSTRPTW